MEQVVDVMSYPVNINIGIGVPLQCLGTDGYFSRLLFWIIAPLVLISLVPLVHLSLYRCRRDGGLHVALLYALPYMLLINFLSFPLVCTIAFAGFDCETFEEGRSYLREDYAVACEDREGNASEEWNVIRVWSITAVLIHAVLIPFCFLALLFSQRRSLFDKKPTKLANALKMLHAPYTPESYFWEFVEKVNKLLLVGVARVAWPGTSLQLVIAITWALFKLTVVTFRHPYRLGTDNLLSAATSLTLAVFLVLVFSFQLDPADHVSGEINPCHVTII